jgi:hypothetical protein
MKDGQVEVAARELCRLRGIDPETEVGHAADPDPKTGFVYDVMLYSRAWKRAAREIIAADRMRQALRAGDES